MPKIGKPELMHLVVLIGLVVGVKTFYGLDVAFLALYSGAHLLLASLAYLVRGNAFAFVRILYTILLIPLSALVVLHADNYSTYGPIVKESLNAIFQTTNDEAVSYLTEFTSASFLPILFVYLALAIGTFWTISTAASNKLLGVGVMLLGVVLIYQGKTIPLMIVETAQDYHQKLNAFKNNRVDALAPFQDVSASDTPRTVVLLLTESLTRHHMSIYGYPRQTTPSLNALTDELMIFPDVISTHSHTNQSLSRALTFNEKAQYANFAELPDLLSVLKLAGISTHWLSNQNTIGRWDNIVSVLSSQADEAKFHDASSGRKLTREIYDEVLLESLDEVLATPSTRSRFIVLHTMATHFPYCQMVPENYVERELSYSEPPMDERFFGGFLPWLASTLNERQIVSYFSSLNCYDRAVNYVDDIAGQVIERLRETNTASAVLITADHGESVIYSSGHDARKHSSMHVEVPFMFWRSNSFPAQQGSTNVKGSLEDLAFSIAGLYDMQGISDLDRRNMFSPAYVGGNRYTLNGRVGYDVFDPNADGLERVRSNLARLDETDVARVWAHRVNSGGTMMDVGQMFAGVESDAVFGDGIFRIFHPPAADVGLTLNALLKQLPRDKKIWLDWKNASLANVPQALETLARLDKEYDIKSRMLIEISATDRSAQPLRQAGWQVSYYLPTAQMRDCIKSCSAEQAQSLAQAFIDVYQTNGFTALSFDAATIGFVESHLKATIVEQQIPSYTWATWIDSSQVDAPDKINEVLERQWIHAVLVSVPSQFRR